MATTTTEVKAIARYIRIPLQGSSSWINRGGLTEKH